MRSAGIRFTAVLFASASALAADPLRLARLGVHEGAVLAVAAHPDGKRAVSGGMDRKVAWWDLEQGALLLKGCPHPDDVAALACDGKSDAVYSTCGDRFAVAGQRRHVVGMRAAFRKESALLEIPPGDLAIH
ncbi:MAG TPA: hypothetical protein VNC50_13120, partial [Planctomycetia bacterium]|nr:hypothetical protein [Planctomycetia bacterium]